MLQTAQQQDVLILGGGLAGLTLALQLRLAHPNLRIGVLERRAHPVPEAAHKVGESTVEIGAHYFADVLGLREHLDQQQIIKFGFRFFFSEGRVDVDRCPELGASRALATGAWQLDRGRFENFLGERVLAAGIDLICAATVKQVSLSETDELHRVQWVCADPDSAGQRHETRARWVIDASGRAGLLKRQLDLAQDNGHHANAVWFRVGSHIDMHDWSTDAAWLNRCTPPERWRSTNHLVGDGYWAWLIPLASGSHSVGIVCDAATHPLEGMKTFELAMQWFHTFQPRLAQALEPMRDQLQDFAFFRHFSYGCKQVFSDRRWALTGEAGVFLDPFYSPGSDFIAISNTYITQLISKDLASEAWQPYAGVYQQLYFSFYESTLSMYRGQYHIFGDAQVMPLKVLWDYTYYWGVLAPLFFAGRIADLPTMSRLKPELAQAMALNVATQALLGDWTRKNSAVEAAEAAPVFLDQASIGWFAELNRALQDPADNTRFRERIRANGVTLQRLAAELVAEAKGRHPHIDTAAVEAHCPPCTVLNTDRLIPDSWRPPVTVADELFA
ncbi:MAG: NAD(P)/FAD-dependent oxidoreductase [Pseudomarimonas sp.]